MGTKKTSVIIIGAGPSGIACAIQLKRFNIDTIIFEKESIGGLIKNANLIENYPGFPNGITGKKYIQLLKKQVINNDLEIITEKTQTVNYSNHKFEVKSDKKEYFSEYLVVASGTKPIVPDIYVSNLGDKIFTEIYKVGNIKNKKVAIVGAGDCAFDYALNLSSENKVSIFNRSKKIKALQILQERVFTGKNVRYFANSMLTDVTVINNKIELSINNTKKMSFDFLLIAVGREPNLDFIGRQTLNNPNLIQIGDVKNGLFRQISISIGDGINAAMKINRLITKD